MPFARWLILLTRPRLFVELGVHKGDSYCAFCEAAGAFRSGTVCFGIDGWQGDKHAGQYGEEIYQDLVDYHDRRYGAFSHLVRSDFQDALERFEDGSIDLLHIDGLHTYHAVRQDFRDWLPKMSPRGVVLFHDTAVHSDDFGVWRFFGEMSRRYPHFEFRHSNGLGVLAVGPAVPPAIAWLTARPLDEQARIRACFTSFGNALLERSRHEEEVRRLTADFAARTDGEARRHAEEIARARQAIERHEHDIALLKGERERLDGDITLLKREQVRLEGDLAAAHRTIDRYEHDIALLKRERERLDGDLAAQARAFEDQARAFAEQAHAFAEQVQAKDAEIHRLAEDGDACRRLLEACTGEMAAFKAQHDALTWERAALQQQALHHQNTASFLIDRLNAVHRSTSWRVTRPLRRMMGLMRGGRRGMAEAGRDMPPAPIPMPSASAEPAPLLPSAPVLPAPPPAAAQPARPSDPKEAFKQEKAAELDAFLATGGRLALPAAEAPAVSILIVLFNQAPLTYACLRSLVETVDRPAEVIIVDNASSDRTGELLDRLDGARIIRNTENLHFLRAVNQGAAEARGRSLLLLNNDTCLYPGSLSAADALLNGAEDIGAVGGRIILLDGTLQEAGSIIWQDGSCLGYGRGCHPLAPEFMFRRDVDYCSGAFLLTRLDLFRRMGGFDMAFAPAYYEETDYCVRLREAGYRIVYEPRVSILHYEFASSSSSAAAIALQTRNRATFIEHHRAHLERHHRPSSTAPLLARMAGRPTGRILIIDDRVPHPTLGSGYPRACSYIGHIHDAGWFITHYPLQFPNDDWDMVYRTLPADVEVMLNHGRDGLVPFLVERAGYYDAILISRPHNMEAFLACRKRYPSLFGGVRILYDAEAITTPREAERLRLAGTPLSARQQERMLKEEMDLAFGADTVLAVSEYEAGQFRAAGHRDVHVLGHLMEPAPTAPGFAERRDLLFVGALDDDPSPNVDSILWFVEEVLPRIRLALPGIRLHLVGRAGAARIQALGGPDIVLSGKLPDLEEPFAQARLFIVPTRYAAGIPHKVYEAAARGVPVVTTPLIARQLGWSDGEQLLVGGDAESFAAQCIRLYTEPELWQRVRDAALARVGEDCDPRPFRAALDAILAPAVPAQSEAALSE